MHSTLFIVVLSFHSAVSSGVFLVRDFNSMLKLSLLRSQVRFFFFYIQYYKKLYR